MIAGWPTAVRRALALAILVTLMLAALGLVWLPLGYLQRQDSGLAAVEHRIRGLQALIPTREALLVEERRLGDTAELDQSLLQGSTPAVAAARLQGDLSGLAAAMGGEVTTVQILEPEPAPPFVRIGLRLGLTGDTATIRDFLYAVETHNPVLIVAAMNLSNGAAEAADKDEDPVLGASFEIYGYAPAAIVR